MNIRQVVLTALAMLILSGCGPAALTPTLPNIPPPNATGAALDVSPTPLPATPAAERATASGPVVFPTLTPITAINAGHLAEIAHLDAAGVRMVAISPDGKSLASAEDIDSRVVIYDMPYTFGVVLLMGHQAKVNDLAWSPAGRTLASASDDGTVRFWDTGTGQELSQIAVDQDGVASLAWSPDGTKIVTGDNRGAAQVWDAQTGGLLLLIQPDADDSTISALAWSADSQSFAAATWLGPDHAGEIKLYDAAAGEQTNGLGDVFAPAPGSLAWSALQPKIAWIRHSDSRAIVWDIPNSAEAVVLSDQRQTHAVAFSADGSLIATGGEDGAARVWDAATGALLATLQGHTDTIHTVRWSNDSLYLVTAGWDGTIRVWGVGNQ